jgi:hypothetical protein
MRLDLFGAGPQRAGTSWLYACLREHPQLCFPRGVKETAFLDMRFDKGWPWYWSHFAHWREGQLCAEIGPSAFDVPEAATRLREHNPACRIIVNLRNPAARSFSLWWHLKSKGYLDCDFREAMRTVPRIVDSSHYRKHMSRWLELFGRQQLLVVLLEDIAVAPGSTLQRMYEFAGIRSTPTPPVAGQRVGAGALPAFPALARLATRAGDWLRDRRLYGPIEFAKKLGFKEVVYAGSSASLPRLEPELEHKLIREFEPDIAYVEELLGRPLNKWRKGTHIDSGGSDGGSAP